MAKPPAQVKQFTARDLQHALARGIQMALSAIEKAIEGKMPIAEEVWTWVTGQIQNIRAKMLLEQHRPDLANLAAKEA